MDKVEKSISIMKGMLENENKRVAAKVIPKSEMSPELRDYLETLIAAAENSVKLESELKAIEGSSLLVEETNRYDRSDKTTISRYNEGFDDGVEHARREQLLRHKKNWPGVEELANVICPSIQHRGFCLDHRWNCEYKAQSILDYFERKKK